MIRRTPWGECQRCGLVYRLGQLFKEWTGSRVCKDCLDPRPAELKPPRYKPEGLPRPDASPETPERFRIWLRHLTIATPWLAENSSPGTIMGPVVDPAASGSEISIIDNDGGRVVLSGSNIVAGLTTLDYEAGARRSFTLRQTLAGATNSPLDTTIYYDVLDTVEIAAPGPGGAFDFTFAASSGLIALLVED